MPTDVWVFLEIVLCKSINLAGMVDDCHLRCVEIIISHSRGSKSSEEVPVSHSRSHFFIIYEDPVFFYVTHRNRKRKFCEEERNFVEILNIMLFFGISNILKQNTHCFYSSMYSESLIILITVQRVCVS